jgi:CBS domain-containing protein
MQAKDVMTWPVISIEPDAPVRTAIIRMLKHRISALPVIEQNGTLVGIVSEGDLLRRAEIGTEHHRPSLSSCSDLAGWPPSTLIPMAARSRKL